MNNYMKVIVNAIKQWTNDKFANLENGFADFENKFTALDNALINKVDKVEGKGLSSNDYTTEEKNKLNAIEAGAQVNVQADFAQNNSDAMDYVKNRTHWIDDDGTVHALDEKFIPDTIARIDEIPSPLPEVTADDNGDVLTVVDGEWGVGTIEVPVTSVNGMTGEVNIEIPEIPEIPETLPNPNALTFTGAVDATYDGSSAVTVEIPEQTQADWEQSDDTSKDYVKNRTHYKQVEDSQEILDVLYEASTLSDKYYQSGLPIACEPVLGASYNVWIYGEGTTRGCVLKQYSDTMWYLGNLTVMPYNWYDGDDTGENFLITFRVSNGQLAFGSTADICTSTYTTPRGDTSFTVTGPGVTYHQLDKKYLPDDVKDFVSKSYIQSINGFTPSYDGSVWMAPYETTEEVNIVEGLYTCTDSGRVYGTQNKAVYETPIIDVEPVELIVGEMYTISAEVTHVVDGDYTPLKSHPLELKVSSEGHLYIGNPAIAGLPDDVGDEFDNTIGVVFYHVNNVVSGLKYCSNSYILYNNGSRNLTITGPQMKYVQLDEKFIPDTIARTADIPSITGLATETYVDTTIANLVNSAPETLDTIGELATAMQENAEVTEALDAAITKKLDTTTFAEHLTDTELMLASSTEGSTKKFKLSIDDNGTLTITEITEEVD